MKEHLNMSTLTLSSQSYSIHLWKPPTQAQPDFVDLNQKRILGITILIQGWKFIKVNLMKALSMKIKNTFTFSCLYNSLSFYPSSLYNTIPLRVKTTYEMGITKLG